MAGIGQRYPIDPGQPVKPVMNQAFVPYDRPQLGAKHVLIVAVPRRRAGGAAEITPHQFNDVDAAVDSSRPDTSDHQFVVQDMVANDVERLATIDPLLHQFGFRVRKPITAFASRATPGCWRVKSSARVNATDQSRF